MNDITLSIIIPAYNEEKKIEQDLNFAYEYFSKQSYSFEIIVVNDGSIDKTLDILNHYNNTVKPIKIVSYEKNRGKGFAIKTGVANASGKYIFFADAGFCVPFEEINKGLKILESGADIALGSRTIQRAKIAKKQPLHRQIGSRLFWILMRFFIGIKGIKDTQCGFKLFKKNAAQNIYPRLKIEGFMFDIEVIYLAQKSGFTIKEFPVIWKNDPDSRFKVFPGAFRVIRDLIRIKLGL